MLKLVAARGSARFGSDQAASDWLAAERDNVVVAAQAVRVADALRAAQQVRPFAVDWTSVADTARRGADGDAQLAAMEYATGLAPLGARRTRLHRVGVRFGGPSLARNGAPTRTGGHSAHGGRRQARRRSLA